MHMQQLLYCSIMKFMILHYTCKNLKFPTHCSMANTVVDQSKSKLWTNLNGVHWTYKKRREIGQ